MHSYRIADLCINVQGNNEYILKRMEDYEIQPAKSDVNVKIEHCEYIDLPESSYIIDENHTLNWGSKANGEKGFYAFKKTPVTGEIADLLDTDEAWRNATISLLNSDIYKDREINPIHAVAYELIGTVFRNRILFHDGIIIHASSIIHDGKGVIFSAPSGTGKSTHVEMWERYKGAAVINDDTPPVRVIDGKPIVYGSPWSGSTDKNQNGKAPLEAIFILEQAPHNSVCRLDNQEAVIRLMPRLFLPYFCDKLMELALKNFENIISLVPVYLLKCRPDKEAMDLAYQCIDNKKM